MKIRSPCPICGEEQAAELKLREREDRQREYRRRFALTNIDERYKNASLDSFIAGTPEPERHLATARDFVGRPKGERGQLLHDKPDCLSATTLIKGIKEIILTERHVDETEVGAADRLPAIIGTAFHKLMEENGVSKIETEIYLESKHESGITVTGHIDAYNRDTGEITDCKTCSVWKIKFSDFDDRDKQGLIHARLLRRNDLPVKNIKFIDLRKDQNRNEAKRSADYPQSPVFIRETDPGTVNLVNIGLFIDLKTAGYVIAGDLKDDEIPPCGRNGRRAREDTFAVMKRGTKKAIRVFPKRAEAEAYPAPLHTRAGRYYITGRPGSGVKRENRREVCRRSDFGKNTGARQREQAFRS